MMKTKQGGNSPSLVIGLQAGYMRVGDAPEGWSVELGALQVYPSKLPHLTQTMEVVCLCRS